MAKRKRVAVGVAVSTKSAASVEKKVASGSKAQGKQVLKKENGFMAHLEKNGKTEANLEPLKKKVVEAEAELTKARNEADALRMQAAGVEEAAKKACTEVLAPYRAACRKAGAKCEFGGGKAGPVAPRVRFLVERVDKGIRVAIKDRPETEEVISDATLKKSIGKAADVFVEKWVGSRQEIGNKAAGLGNRFRKVFRSE